jgi:hypothetical protein
MLRKWSFGESGCRLALALAMSMALPNEYIFIPLLIGSNAAQVE